MNPFTRLWRFLTQPAQPNGRPALWDQPTTNASWDPAGCARVRWIETRGCMAEVDHKVSTGLVVREYLYGPVPNAGFYKSTPFWEIHLDNGEVFHFPKAPFLRAPDGVYEYRY